MNNSLEKIIWNIWDLKASEVLELIAKILETSSEMERRILSDKIMNIIDIPTTPHNWISEKLEARKSSTEWEWIFVSLGQNVKEGELVAIFWWKVHTLEEWFALPNNLNMWHIMIHGWYTIWAWSDREVDGGDYINHSCDPSCWLKGQICLYAIRDMSPWDEITFDYGTVLGGIDTDILRPIMPEIIDENNRCVVLFDDCNCNAANCRWSVTSNDRKLLQREPRLEGCFSPHIQELIDKS